MLMYWSEENSTSVHSEAEAVVPKDDLMEVGASCSIAIRKKAYTGKIAAMGKNNKMATYVLCQ